MIDSTPDIRRPQTPGEVVHRLWDAHIDGRKVLITVPDVSIPSGKARGGSKYRTHSVEKADFGVFTIEVTFFDGIEEGAPVILVEPTDKDADFLEGEVYAPRDVSRDNNAPGDSDEYPSSLIFEDWSEYPELVVTVEPDIETHRRLDEARQRGGYVPPWPEHTIGKIIEVIEQ